MSDTSTLAVDPFVADVLLAQHVLDGRVSAQEQRWFALIMPILRDEIAGVTITDLCGRIGVQYWHDDLYLFVYRLQKAGVIWWDNPNTKCRNSSLVLRLSPNYWLKETARRQAAPCTYTVDEFA